MGRKILIQDLQSGHNPEALSNNIKFQIGRIEKNLKDSAEQLKAYEEMLHSIRDALKNSPAIKENKEVRAALNKRVVEISRGVAKIEMEQTKAREAGDVKVRASQYKSVKNLWKESGLPEGTAVDFLTFGPTHMNRQPQSYDFRKKIKFF